MPSPTGKERLYKNTVSFFKGTRLHCEDTPETLGMLDGDMIEVFNGQGG